MAWHEGTRNWTVPVRLEKHCTPPDCSINGCSQRANEEGAKREPRREPKRNQNRSQKEVKIYKGKSCVLGATCVDLGPIWGRAGGTFLLIFYRFLYYFKQIDVFETNHENNCFVINHRFDHQLSRGTSKIEICVKNDLYHT